MDLLAKADALSRRAQELLAETKIALGEEPKPVQDAPVEKKIEMVFGVTRVPEGVRFLTRFPEAQTVFVAGDFNNWSAEATGLKRLNGDMKGDWEICLPLESGRYRYRFVVDGAWQHDPHNNYVESNPYGELNSVVEVA